MPRIAFPRPPKKIHQRQLEVRAQLWPHITAADLWSRHTHDGFSTVPSTMPLVMSIMDDLAGQPVSLAYLDLWTRAYDESFVALSKPREMAFHAGLVSQRAERTWKLKLRALHKLGFIVLKSGPSGPESYALILNPYLVIRGHHEQKTPGLREDKYNALVVRALEIGDKTFAPPVPTPTSVKPSRPATPVASSIFPPPAPPPPPRAAAPTVKHLKLRPRGSKTAPPSSPGR